MDDAFLLQQGRQQLRGLNAGSTHQDRLLALTGMSGKNQARYCADFFWGLRALGIAGK